MQQRHRERRDFISIGAMVALAASGLLALIALIAATLPSSPSQPIYIAQGLTTATAVTKGMFSEPTTFTARTEASSGSLLDRLARNKPGIWGNKLFYVGLGGAYVVLLSLFFYTIFRLAREAGSEKEDSP